MNVSIRYDEGILKSAISAYIKRVYFKHLVWPTLLALGTLFYTYFMLSLFWQIMLMLPLLLIPSILLLGYWMRIKHSLKTLSLLDDGRVDITISEDGFTSTSAIGQSHLKWKMFSELWDTPEAYLLIYTNNQFVTLPKAQVSDSFIEEIRKQISAKK